MPQTRRHPALGPSAAAVIAVLAVGTLVAGCRPDGSGPERRSTPVSAGGSVIVTDTDPRDPTAVATGLDPGLVMAFDRAHQAATEAGHSLTITSGHRSPERQQQLLDEAVAEHGSLAVALRWVFPPERSMHVQGLAVDVGDGPAADWLAEHGAPFGLCQTLGWEWWHFEWRARWEADGACPPPVDDPADAPGP